eukprot:gene9431-biopygen22725
MAPQATFHTGGAEGAGSLPVASKKSPASKRDAAGGKASEMPAHVSDAQRREAEKDYPSAAGQPTPARDTMAVKSAKGVGDAGPEQVATALTPQAAIGGVTRVRPGLVQRPASHASLPRGEQKGAPMRGRLSVRRATETIPDLAAPKGRYRSHTTSPHLTHGGQCNGETMGTNGTQRRQQATHNMVCDARATLGAVVISGRPAHKKVEQNGFVGHIVNG